MRDIDRFFLKSGRKTEDWDVSGIGMKSQGFDKMLISRIVSIYRYVGNIGFFCRYHSNSGSVMKLTHHSVTDT